MAPEVTIRNQSDKTISLIPYSCLIGVNPRSSVFPVKTDSAINIPAGKSTTVKPKKYDSSDTVSDSQIYMLFRAGPYPETVTPLAHEKLFLCTGQSGLSAKAEWKLSLGERKQVIGGPGYAGAETSSGANAADSQLEILKKKVQDLEEKVAGLLRTVAVLEHPRPC